MTEEEVIDLNMLKVVELKSELKQRSLPVSGTKAELIERLETYMQKHEDVELVEEDDYVKNKQDSAENTGGAVNGTENKTNEGGDSGDNTGKDDSLNNSANSPPPANSISMAEDDEDIAANLTATNDVKPNVTSSEINTMSEKDRKTARKDRFSDRSLDGPGDTIKKKSRAERFGLSINESSKNMDSEQLLKRRAERFNLAESGKIKVSKSGLGELDSDKMKSRAERFGKVIVDKGDVDAVLQSRRDRFGIV